MGKSKPIDDWVQKYYSGMTLRDISANSNYSHETIRQGLVRSGCKMSRRGKPYKNGISPQKKQPVIKKTGKRYASSIEMIMDMITPDKLEYVGDHKYIVYLPSGVRKHPDFLYRKKKKIVELYGEYWHKGEDPQDAIAEYQSAGYDCLVIWEYELRDKNMVLAKISDFLGMDSWQMTMPITAEEQRHQKVKCVMYLRKENATLIKSRAKTLNMTQSAYITELAMWDNRHDLIRQLRKGGSIICNGKAKD